MTFAERIWRSMPARRLRCSRRRRLESYSRIFFRAITRRRGRTFWERGGRRARELCSGGERASVRACVRTRANGDDPCSWLVCAAAAAAGGLYSEAGRRVRDGRRPPVGFSRSPGGGAPLGLVSFRFFVGGWDLVGLVR